MILLSVFVVAVAYNIAWLATPPSEDDDDDLADVDYELLTPGEKAKKAARQVKENVKEIKRRANEWYKKHETKIKAMVAFLQIAGDMPFR